MKIVSMRLDEMIKPDKNVRIHTQQQIKEFERSIKMFGQIRPIVVDENNVILAGNGLYDTLVKMGKKTADVYKFDNLTENQKKKLMIADNKIFSLGIDNLDTLNCFLEEMQGDLDIPGFDEEILKQMVSDAEEITDKISEYGTLDDEEIQHIKDNAERKANKNQEAGTDESSEPQSAITVPASDVIKEEQDEETADIRKFVICPNCGEKIWL